MTLTAQLVMKGRLNCYPELLAASLAGQWLAAVAFVRVEASGRASAALAHAVTLLAKAPSRVKQSSVNASCGDVRAAQTIVLYSRRKSTAARRAKMKVRQLPLRGEGQPNLVYMTS